VEQAVPDTLHNEVNEAVLAYLRELSAHGDVADALAGAVEPLGDVQTFCPDALQYRYVAVATRAVIFGFAAGMSTIGFRLPPELRTRALVSGAEECAPAGPDWVSLTLFRDDWPEPDIRFWARKAYAYARERERV
jgi:hypothetical protein